MPGPTSLARILLLSLVLSGLPATAGPGEPPPALTSAALPIPDGDAAPDRFVPGRVLVGFERGAQERQRRAAAAAIGGRVAGGEGRARVVALDRGADVAAVARRLAARPEVAFAEPDWLRRVDACLPAVCWHLQARPGANLVAARRHGTGQGRTVAVVDTGVARDPDDPRDPGDPVDDFDLGDRVAERWRCRLACTRLDPAAADTLTDPADPADPLTCSHGTEVAGVVAAADDGDGTTGAAPQATVVSYRVDRADVHGGGCQVPISAVAAALRQIAADPEVDVVNLSLGGTRWSRTEQAAVAGLLAAGKSVVAAAGNDGSRTPRYPAAYPGVISVGASDAAGRMAAFSSHGKVDVVAPGVCLAAPEVAGARQPGGCPGDRPGDGVARLSGTSYAAPVVAGLLALADSPSPLRARLALQASAAAAPDGPDAKAWGHGLADAAAFVAAHDPAAPPALVLETSGRGGPGGHRFGSGDGQLAHPGTTFDAYAFHARRDLAASPGTADFSLAATGQAPFAALPGDPGLYRASLAVAALAPGPWRQRATAVVEGRPVTASAPVLALHPDDQAPGVALVGDGDDAWRRLGSVDGDDPDDVYAVTLAAGDRLDATIAGTPGRGVAARLFAPGTTDVDGQVDRDHVVACAGAAIGCPSRLRHTAATAGTYLLDLVATDPAGRPGAYRLTWQVAGGRGLTLQVPVAACSPNGDRVRDRCRWTAGILPGWAATSFVTRGTGLVRRLDGAGGRSWDGRDQTGARRPDGRYALRVLAGGPGGRALLRTVALTLDTRRPRISAAGAAPNPFEPRPRDGDRDTTTFAMTSSEPGRFRALLSRAGTGTPVRVLSGRRAAGRQRLRWDGRAASGAWPRGPLDYLLETTDAAGNTARSPRHRLHVR